MNRKRKRRLKLKVRYDWVLFALLMLFLFASIIQKQTGLIRFRPLGGVIVATPKPQLSFETYRNNSYQQQLEKYASENFGLREPVIRIYNQYLWTTFNKTYCNFIRPGKNGWLYYKSAVDEYYGLDIKAHHLSNTQALWWANSELDRMDSLRRMLNRHGITFLAFIAPDKPWVYPENLPDMEADTTAFKFADHYDRRMTEMGFPHINMTKWFMAARDTATIPLFSPTESHWDYSAIFGYDSLFRYMNTLGGPRFPKMHIGPPIAYELDKPEGDESTLNLLFRIRSAKTRYKAKITVEPTATRKPRVLFVGDSFIWSMESLLPCKELMDDKEVWYYNNTAFVGHDKTKFDVKEMNRLRHILKADYVVFYAAGHQWREGTFGFVEDALKQFSQATETDIAKARMANDIERDKDWLLALKIYASTHDKPLEETLLQEAENMLNDRTLLREGIVLDTAEIIRIKKEEIMRNFRASPVHTKLIEEKAEKRGITFEEMLEIDAQWVVKQRLEKGELF